MKQNCYKDDETSILHSFILVQVKLLSSVSSVCYSYLFLPFRNIQKNSYLSVRFSGHWFNLSSVVLRRVGFLSYYLTGERAELIIVRAGSTLGGSILWYSWLLNQEAMVDPSHIFGQCSVFECDCSFPCAWGSEIVNLRSQNSFSCLHWQQDTRRQAIRKAWELTQAHFDPKNLAVHDTLVLPAITLFFFFFFIVVDFVIHWNETAMGLNVFPIPIPPPTSLSTRSL